MAVGANLLIQYSERMTGQAHPTYSDTLNRAIIIDHAQDGHHKWALFHENTEQTTSTDQFWLGVKNDGTNTQLYGRTESNGTVFQITKGAALYTGNNVCSDADLTTGTDALKIVTPVRAQRFVYRDGTRALSADWDIGTGRFISSEKFRARSSAGLRLEDDAGNLGVFIEDGGQVGIGNNTPGHALDVTGMINSSSDVIVGGNFVTYGDTINLAYQTIGTSNLRIGYGRTVDGLSALYLIGDTTYTAFGSAVIRASGANGNTIFQHRGTGYLQLLTSDSGPIKLTIGAQDRLYLNSDGNMGLGTATFGTSAARVFTIYNSTAPTTSPADAVQLYALDRAAGKRGLGVLTEDGTTHIFSDVVGINTTTPSASYKLHVNGAGYVSGTLTVGGVFNASVNAYVSNGYNLGVGSNTFGTSAANVLGIYNSTAPTTAPTDTVQLYAKDCNGIAGAKSLHQMSETGQEEIVEGIVFASSAPTGRYGLIWFDTVNYLLKMYCHNGTSLNWHAFAVIPT